MLVVVNVIVLLLAGGGAGGGGGRAQQPGRGNSTGMLPTLMLIVDQCVNCPPPNVNFGLLKGVVLELNQA